VSNNQDDLQIITEISYFFISKAIKINVIKNLFIIDRIILLFNSEDFLKETIQEALDIKINFLSMLQRPRMINFKLNDYLYKMRISDLEDKNVFYNHIQFLNSKKTEYDHLIAQGYFGNLLKENVIEEGKKLHEKLFIYIGKKFDIL
jgi:hypothetical protein